MGVTTGSRIGPYEVVSRLGAGGMGEVFAARDTRLGRDVAIKVITPSRAIDRDAIARFEREARAAAALSHPNIVAIFDVGTHDDSPFIVSELLQGETIRQRLSGGPISQKRAVDWSVQIADALAAAHAKGIVHRDLKPENLFVTTDDRVKVLDFGLARLVDLSGADQLTQAAEPLHTESGVVLGTTGYMSPEQVAGRTADHRADVFSLGLVLHELLTGQRAFRRETPVETMSAILNDEAIAPSAINPNISPAIDRIVLRCLEKKADRRFQSASDLSFALSTAITSSGSQPLAATAPSSTRRSRLAVAGFATVAVAALIGFGLGLQWNRPSPAPKMSSKHFIIDMQALPLSQSLAPIAISRDGSTLAYAAGSFQASQLYVRPLGQLAGVALSGTLDGRDPFFSPDGRWIGFSSQGELRKVPAGGGPVVTVAAIGLLGSPGGSWGSDGWIYYSYGTRLWKVAENGGTPQALTTPDTGSGELLHYWPQVLPGNKALLVTVITSTGVDASRVEIVPIGGGPARTLIEGAAFGRYLKSGHLFFMKGSTGFVVRFDADRQVLEGEPRAVLENVATGAGASAQFVASDDGTIAFVEGVSVSRRAAVSVDRSGAATALNIPPRAIEGLTMSPDERRLAVVARDRTARDVWILDVDTQSLSQLTLDGTVAGGVVWRPDSRQITFSRRLRDRSELVTQSVEGIRAEQPLWSTADQTWPGSWTADGRHLFLMRYDPVSAGDLDVLDAGESKPRSALSSKATEWGARVSPDGNWLAYVSNATGNWEVYIQPWPGPGTPRRISLDGGTEVVWGKNGRELFYRNGTKLMAVPVTLAPAFSTGAPRVLFDRSFVLGQPGLPNYDVSRDGQRFYMVQRGPDEGVAQPIHVIVNWFNELRP